MVGPGVNNRDFFMVSPFCAAPRISLGSRQGCIIRTVLHGTRCIAGQPTTCESSLRSGEAGGCCVPGSPGQARLEDQQPTRKITQGTGLGSADCESGKRRASPKPARRRIAHRYHGGARHLSRLPYASSPDVLQMEWPPIQALMQIGRRGRHPKSRPRHKRLLLKADSRNRGI